jgi:hypothetical protein
MGGPKHVRDADRDRVGLAPLRGTKRRKMPWKRTSIEIAGDVRKSLERTFLITDCGQD